MAKPFSQSRLSVWLLAAAVCAASGQVRARAAAQAPDAQPHDTLVAIVSTENGLDHLSMGDLRRILLGEMTRWPDGRNITIAMRPAGRPERDSVLKLVCGMTDTDFDRHLLRSSYRGDTSSVVKALDTSVGVRRFVVNVPGAIGFVRRDEVDKSVKVMPLTGTVPTDAAFGLRIGIR